MKTTTVNEGDETRENLLKQIKRNLSIGEVKTALGVDTIREIENAPVDELREIVAEKIAKDHSLKLEDTPMDREMVERQRMLEADIR